MKYLRVKNWEKLQHQSDKPLPWIKFFTALLAPTKEPCYSDWPDATKALLHHLWLMARVFNNRIPETWLTREKLNLKSRVNLDPLLDAGFIWFESESGERLSHSRTRDARSGVSNSGSLGSSSEGEREGKPPAFDAVFDELWARYPRPRGKEAALKHFQAAVTTEEDAAAIRRALENYLASSEVERGYVQNGSTWFNNWRDWENANGEMVRRGPDGLVIHPPSKKETTQDSIADFKAAHGDRDWAVRSGEGAAWDDAFAKRFGVSVEQMRDYLQHAPAEQSVDDYLSALSEGAPA